MRTYCQCANCLYIAISKPTNQVHISISCWLTPILATTLTTRWHWRSSYNHLRLNCKALRPFSAILSNGRDWLHTCSKSSGVKTCRLPPGYKILSSGVIDHLAFPRQLYLTIVLHCPHLALPLVQH